MGECLHKVWYIHTKESSKKEWTLYLWNNLDESPRNYIEWKKKTVSEDCVLHDLFDLYKMFEDEILEIKNRLVLHRS